MTPGGKAGTDGGAPGEVDERDRWARLELARLVEPGSWGLHAEVEARGAVEVREALASGARLQGLSGQVREAAAARAADLDLAEDRRRLERCGGRVVVPGDREWPDAALLWSPSDGSEVRRRWAPPLALVVRGPWNLADLATRSVALVGARAATAYGVHVAGDLGRRLADRGWAVVSGGAYGVDASAHRAALDAGGAPTVAVLACGADVAYPRGNDRLLARVAEQGLVVSELPLGAAPTRSRFLVRNRLIAALSRGTVVVEAAARSGSLSTAHHAEDLARVVMAVPGPITSSMSTGCHELLRRPGVALVASAGEVLSLVGELSVDGSEPERGPVTERDALPAAARAVLDAVPVKGGAGEATLARAAGVPVLVVQQVLPPLMVAGLVRRSDTGWCLTPLGAGLPVPAR